MVRISRYRLYLVLQMAIVGAVLILFRTISDAKLAGVLAGVLFLIGPSVVIWFEVVKAKFWKSWSFWGSAIFLFASALPIFLLRIFYWSEPFESLVLLGIPGPMWHKISTYFFAFMLLGIFTDSFIYSSKSLRASKKEGAH